MGWTGLILLLMSTQVMPQLPSIINHRNQGAPIGTSNFGICTKGRVRYIRSLWVAATPSNSVSAASAECVLCWFIPLIICFSADETTPPTHSPTLTPTLVPTPSGKVSSPYATHSSHHMHTMILCFASQGCGHPLQSPTRLCTSLPRCVSWACLLPTWTSEPPMRSCSSWPIP